MVAPTQSLLAGVVSAPVGSDTAMKSDRATQVTAADHQVTARMLWRTHSRRRTRAKTSSVTRSGCTTDMSPLWSASAWNTKAPASATQPNSHNGFTTRYRTNCQPLECPGSPMLARCWVTTFSALQNAARRANTMGTAPLWSSGRGSPHVGEVGAREGGVRTGGAVDPSQAAPARVRGAHPSELVELTSTSVNPARPSLAARSSGSIGL